ncbi:hypothetical protein FOZ61_010075, partial [Perkinsus olseni]
VRSCTTAEAQLLSKGSLSEATAAVASDREPCRVNERSQQVHALLLSGSLRLVSDTGRLPEGASTEWSSLILSVNLRMNLA